MAKSMYDIIKKQNGERFAKAIRNYDNGIFEIPNIDKIVKYAGRVAEPLMAYLISLKDIRIEEQSVHMDPIALLDRAGYDAFVADTLEKQNSIKHYYAPGEELCTFRDPSRFKNYYIINAVRKDVDTIRRADFQNPEREDKYGTSVISIQVLKTGGFISIKNRYNHTVVNPDNTLGSNPDNIIFGLSDAIRHHFGVDFSAQAVPVPEGYRMVQGHLVKYDYERNDVYVAENCYFHAGKLYEIDTNSEIMLGHGLLLDLRAKMVRDITDVNNGDGYNNAFVDEINRIIADKKLRVEKNSDGGRNIIADGEVIFSVRDGDLTYVNLPNARVVKLSGRKHLRGNLDFSGATEYLAMDSADLGAVTGLTLPRDTKDLILTGTDLPAVDLDLGHMTGNVQMRFCDLSRVTRLTMPKNAVFADFSDVTFPAVDLDLGVLDTRTKMAQPLFLNNADLSAVKSLKLPNNMYRVVYMRGVKMPAGVLDLSNVEGTLDLSGFDLSAVTKLILPSELDSLILGNVKMPALDLDFSGVTRYLDISGIDLRASKSLKLPPKDVSLNITGTALPAIDLDLSQQGVGMFLSLDGADLSAVQSLVLPTGINWIDMSRTVLPAIDLDLSDASVCIKAGRADFSRLKSLKLPINVSDVADFSGVKFPHVDLDFSDIECFDKFLIVHADFRAVKSLKFPKYMKNLSVAGCKFPPIDLDFSGVTGFLNLDYADLSAVKSLKMPTSPSVRVRTYGTTMPVQPTPVTEAEKTEKSISEIFARGKDRLTKAKRFNPTQQQGYENE